MASDRSLLLREIREITRCLVLAGMVDDQNVAFETQTASNIYCIQHPNWNNAMLKNLDYAQAYYEQRSQRSFNLLMLDGAMVQMRYVVSDQALLRHRLAFLPAPDLLEYQNDPELYGSDPIYADVIDKRTVTVPVRFDFKGDTSGQTKMPHPKSHLTLGQYKHCRIPATAALTPHSFMDFILSAFYNKARMVGPLEMPHPRLRFDRCISNTERDVVHLAIPNHL